MPKKPLGFRLSTTMSWGSGAISSTISLPSRSVRWTRGSSSVRVFFQDQLPESQLSS
jgi:hypothetical protein